MQAAWRELCTTLDVEVHGLPEKYRAPIVLCYLEGQTRDQAARQLGWSLRNLERRLEQGRERLRARLARRGITLTAALLAAGLSPQTGLSTLPALLVEQMFRPPVAWPPVKLVPLLGFPRRRLSLRRQQSKGRSRCS
jgi:hypothetical protein